MRSQHDIAKYQMLSAERIDILEQSDIGLKLETARYICGSNNTWEWKIWLFSFNPLVFKKLRDY